MSDDASIRLFYTLLEATGNLTLAFVVWFAGAVGVAVALHGAAIVLLRRMTEEGGPARKVINRTRGLTRVVWILVAMFVALPVVDMDAGVAELVRRVLKIGVIGTLGWTAVLTINTVTQYVKRYKRLDVEDNLEARRLHTQIGLLRQTVLTIVVLVTVGAMLMTFPSVQAYGVSLFASAGVAGIVLGFAARPILASLIAGIQIALTQPIRIDDVVIVEKEWGWIEEITSTYVIIRLWDLRRLIVPLSHFIEKPFENWTRESADIIGTVFWHVDHRAPIDAMRKKLSEMLEAHPLWNRKVANLQVVEASAHSLQVRALMSARNSPQAWDLRCDIREQMIAWLQKEHPDALPRLRASLGEMPSREQDGERRPYATAAE